MVTLYRPENAKWKVAVYPGAEHGMPHFHIEGPGYRCSVAIETRRLIIGSAPRAVMKAAVAWAEENTDLLWSTWKELDQ